MPCIFTVVLNLLNGFFGDPLSQMASPPRQPEIPVLHPPRASDVVRLDAIAARTTIYPSPEHLHGGSHHLRIQDEVLQPRNTPHETNATNEKHEEKQQNVGCFKGTKSEGLAWESRPLSSADEKALTLDSGEVLGQDEVQVGFHVVRGRSMKVLQPFTREPKSEVKVPGPPGAKE